MATGTGSVWACDPRGPVKPCPGTLVVYWEGKAVVGKMYDVSLEVLGATVR